MTQAGKNIFDYLEIVKRRKWLIAVPLLAGAGAGAVIGYAMPAYYRSTTLIMVDEQQVPQSYVTPTDTTPIEKRLSAINQQIMSRTQLEKIVDDFKLYETGQAAQPAGLKARLKATLGMTASKPLTKEDAVEMLRSDIGINVVDVGGGKKLGNAFKISYSGSDPYLTMQVTNTIASLFIDENLKQRERYAEGTSDFLANELDKAKHELEQQEQTLRRFKESRMGSLPEQLDANLRTLDRLQTELQSVTGSLKTTYVSELDRLKSELAALTATYKENYPDVVTLKNRIKELEEQMTSNVAAQPDATGKPVTDAPADIMSLKTREAKLRQQIKAYEARVETAPANEQRLADIKRDYSISLQNYQSLLEKKLGARLAENLEKRQKGEKFRVIDPANLPQRPYKPDRVSITFTGLAAGGVVGAGLALLFEFLNPAFRKPEELAGLFDKEVLAVIPHFTGWAGEPAGKKSGLFRTVKDRQAS
ncbi:MAG: hypothetical protein HY886_02475 [Deltaproteobacteria bacterium]|nr:hypothetical protein [Deltaproteobacteria bacterium]